MTLVLLHHAVVTGANEKMPNENVFNKNLEP